MSCALVTLLFVPFQNCTRVENKSTSSSTNSNAQGGGIEGKPFFSYGMCPSGKKDLKTAIVFSDDSSSATLTRDNCQNLSSPAPIAKSSLRFLLSTSTALIYNDKVFDGQTGKPD